MDENRKQESGDFKMTTRSKQFAIKISGDSAVFTNPVNKPSRYSYPIITPTAAVGIFECIFWDKNIKWIIDEIQIIKPIQYGESILVNEWNSKVTSQIIEQSYSQKHRTQCYITPLKDVEYIVKAHFVHVNPFCKPRSIIRYTKKINKRLKTNTPWKRAYLGCAGLLAEISPINGTEIPIQESINYENMIWYVKHDKKNTRIYFYNANMINGVIKVPPVPNNKENNYVCQ